MSKKLRKPWIGNKTWEKIKGEERGKIDIARSERLKQRWREEYNAKNNDVKRSTREDKKNWLEKRAAAAETSLKVVGRRSYTALLSR